MLASRLRGAAALAAARPAWLGPNPIADARLPALLPRRLSGGALPASFDNIIVEKRDKVALITLHRPKALNALNSALMCVPAPAHASRAPAQCVPCSPRRRTPGRPGIAGAGAPAQTLRIPPRRAATASSRSLRRPMRGALRFG